MKYGLVFGLLSLSMIYAGCSSQPFGLLLLWPAAAFLAASLAYFLSRPGMFGKRENGSIGLLHLVLLFPFFLLTWSVWHLSRCIRRESCYHEISPGYYLGRRPLEGELPEEIMLVVDLTAEFAERRKIREEKDYLCLPILDAGVPCESDFEDLILKLLPRMEPMYIHCAEGHGRSAMVLATLIMCRENTGDVNQIESLIRSIRPGVHMKKAQQGLATRVYRKVQTGLS